MFKLEDLKPKQSTLKLETTGREYILRPFTLRDEIWLKQEYGDKLEIIFDEKNMDFNAICRIVYRLITDKTDFKKKEVLVIDEDGSEETKCLGGYILFSEMVAGFQAKLDVLNALNETMGLSREMVDEIAKKKVEVDQEKQTGEK